MSRRLAIPSPGWLDRAPTWVHRTAVGAGLVGALALGVVGPSQAFADPGGAPNANASATAQGSAGSNASNAGATGSPGNSAAAPGQVKQDPGPTVSSQGGILVSSLTTSSGNTKDYPNPGATKDNPVLPNYTGSTTTGSTGDVKSGSAASHDTGSFGSTDVIHQPQPLSTADQNSGGANGQCSGTNNGPYCSTRDGAPSLNGNGNGNAYGKPCAGCVGRADNKNPQGQKPGGSDHNAGYECDSNKGIGKTNPAHTGCTSTPPQCVPTDANHHCGTDCVPTGANHHCGTDCVPTDANHHCGSDCVPTANNNNCQPPQCQAGQSGTPPNCVTNHPQCVPTADNPCTTPTGCVATAANNFCGNPPSGCKPTPANNFCSEVLGEVNQKPTVVDGVSLPTTNKPGVQVLGEKVTRGGTLPFTGTDALGLATTSALFLLGGTVLLWLGRRRRTA